MSEKSDLDYLRQLGNGESIDSLCHQNEWTVEAFNQWWQSQLQSRLPTYLDSLALDVSEPVDIQRDACGIPHIYARNDHDLFLGFGFALAQDRLFQLDYLASLIFYLVGQI